MQCMLNFQDFIYSPCVFMMGKFDYRPIITFLTLGMVEEFELPYSSMLTSSSSSSEETTPTLDEMRAIVCERQKRPPTADQWNRDQVRIIA